jgi:hypothetical protein
MRTFAQKQKQPQKLGSSNHARSHTATPGLHHRADLILHGQRTMGNQAVQRMLQTHAEELKAGLTGTSSPQGGHNFSRIPRHTPAAGAIQTKLAISQPRDEYEQEADRISEHVMRMPEPRLQPACTCGGACPTCQTEPHAPGHERLHTKRVGSGDWGLAEVPTIVHEVLRSPGRPLDLATRAFMEPRFGYDFSRVRVHTDENAETSARTLNAHAYTVGNDIVFGLGRFDSTAAEGRRLLAHELTHVVQQSVGHAPQAVAHKPAGAEKDSTKDVPKAAPKPPKCHTGCAQRWGQDTTCSKWGFFQGVAEQGEGKKWRSFNCCNSWPLSVEDYARTQLGLSGAASCTVQHEREIATISFGGNEVEVLCSDTIPNSMFGENTRASACSGSIATEVIEMSPKAMQALSSQLASALHVKVCYSGSKEDLCLHNGPGARSFPTIHQCLTKGCSPWEGTPTTHQDSGWPRV